MCHHQCSPTCVLHMSIPNAGVVIQGKLAGDVVLSVHLSFLRSMTHNSSFQNRNTSYRIVLWNKLKIPKFRIYNIGMAAIENAGSEPLENIGWSGISGEDYVGLGERESGGIDFYEKRESVGTDFNEKSHREDLMQKGKTEFLLKEKIESEVCSMCQAWQEIGDGFRFHLPEDLFSTPASLNTEEKEKWGDSDIEDGEDEEKNYCEEEKEEENEEDAVEGTNQVVC